MKSPFVRILALCALCALLAAGAAAGDDEGAAQLTGTLAKARASGLVAIAYRESSVPFSFLSPRG